MGFVRRRTRAGSHCRVPDRWGRPPAGPGPRGRVRVARSRASVLLHSGTASPGRRPFDRNLDVGGPGVSATEPRGRIFISDDEGQTWQFRGSFPLIHARPFYAGGRVYILGHEGDLKIVASADRGWTWSAPSLLTTNEPWHGTAASVWANGQFVYLVMEQRIHHRVRGWPVSELAPVLWRGRADADLLRRENWTRANSLSFQEAPAKLQPPDPGEGVGIPWFAAPYPSGSMPARRRPCAPMGWLEGNVVQILDPTCLVRRGGPHLPHLAARPHRRERFRSDLESRGTTRWLDGFRTRTCPIGPHRALGPLPGRSHALSRAMGSTQSPVLAAELAEHRFHGPPGPPARGPIFVAQQRAAPPSAALFSQYDGLVFRRSRCDGCDPARGPALRRHGFWMARTW